MTPIMLWLGKAPDTQFPFASGADEIRTALVGLNEGTTISLDVKEFELRLPVQGLFDMFSVTVGEHITLGFESRYSLKISRVCSSKMLVRAGTVVNYGLIIDSVYGINVRRERDAAWAALEIDCEGQHNRYDYGPLSISLFPKEINP